jgi:hypothetical protein
MNTNRYRFCVRLTAACVPIFCFAGTQAKVNVDFGKVPLSFEANRGQTDARVDYLSRGKGYTLLLTRDQAVLRLKDGAPLRMKLLGASGQAGASGWTNCREWRITSAATIRPNGIPASRLTRR